MTGGDDRYYEMVSDALSVIVLWIPRCFSQICLILIFLKYQLSLFTLNLNLKMNVQSCEQTLKVYVDLYDAFRDDIAFWSLFFGIQISAYALDTWSVFFKMGRNELGMMDLAHIFVSRFFYGLPIALTMVASNGLGAEFRRFRRRIDCTMVKDARALQLYNYVHANELVFGIGGIELNYSNSIKMLCVFVITEIVSYSLFK